MFKKSLFFVYSLSAIFVFAVLFACGDSGNSPSPGDSSNSNKPLSTATNPENAVVTININRFNVIEEFDYLDIEVKATVTGFLEGDVPALFEKVDILLGNTIMNSPTQASGKGSYTWSNEYNVSNYCTGNQEVCVYAYLGGKAYTGTGNNNCKSFQRTGLAGSCKSSSSIAPLSSSSIMEVAKNISFDQVKSVTLATGRGIILNGITTGADDQSDIYFTKEGTKNVMKTDKANITIIEMFNLPGGIYSDVSTSDIPENSVTPQKFGFKQGDGEKSTDYHGGFYFAVRANGATDWDTNCYLVLWPSVIMSDGNAEIKVWKVVQN
jgi:hypothetical protein